MIMDTKQIIEKTEALIDALRATCSAYGLSSPDADERTSNCRIKIFAT